MRLYINTKIMTFKEENYLIEHELILDMSDTVFYGYDRLIELPDDDKLIQDTLKIEYKKDEEGKDTKEREEKIFMIREQKSWWSFPKYEIKEGNIIPFDYTQYNYFSRTDRRMMLAGKINQLYNPPAEAKILRKTLKIILDKLGIECLEFQKYHNKIEDIINKNPKEKIK